MSTTMAGIPNATDQDYKIGDPVLFKGSIYYITVIETLFAVIHPDIPGMYYKWVGSKVVPYAEISTNDTIKVLYGKN